MLSVRGRIPESSLLVGWGNNLRDGGKMTRFVLISDTHMTQPLLPSGDILVHAGDHTLSGSRKETEAAFQWLGIQARKFKYIVTVGGNHDWFAYHAHSEVMRDFIRPFASNIVYLENESALLCMGSQEISFYGSPVQPEFCNWAWNEARGTQIKATWDRIPNNVDVLVTHGPPHHVLDWVGRERVGCQDLRDALDRAQPQVHVFGHIHAGYGKAQTFVQGGRTTQCYNASVVGEDYKLDPQHKPWVLDYDGETFVEVKPDAV
jgi:Icc-related predicted phosphoesterase